MCQRYEEKSFLNSNLIGWPRPSVCDVRRARGVSEAERVRLCLSHLHFLQVDQHF